MTKTRRACDGTRVQSLPEQLVSGIWNSSRRGGVRRATLESPLRSSAAMGRQSDAGDSGVVPASSCRDGTPEPADHSRSETGDRLHGYQPELDPERCGRLSVGVDIIEIARIQRTLNDFGDRFLRKVFTERERERYGSRVSELAARFAAKEATSKALGTGIRGIRWREMEVLSNRRGKPVLILHGSAAERAAMLGLIAFDVSLTHSRSDAMAFVVAMKDPLAAIADNLDSEDDVDSTERN